MFERAVLHFSPPATPKKKRCRSFWNTFVLINCNCDFIYVSLHSHSMQMSIRRRVKYFWKRKIVADMSHPQASQKTQEKRHQDSNTVNPLWTQKAGPTQTWNGRRSAKPTVLNYAPLTQP
ncbi:MAG: hypothetical protein SPH82_00930, partial [Eubacteriales bacterium]|nr:hypothetical protein [Eubacteriales bacterium]